MYGFNTAVKGLVAAQRGLYVTNHNINNINTKGYSRQKALQQATTPFDLLGVGFLGTGTEVYDVIRVRNSYIDFKYWNESAPKGEWSVKQNTLLEIEKIMGEPSNTSFRKYMDDFFKALDEMSTNPSDYSYREPVRETALALTKHINETAVRLQKLSEEIDFSIETKAKKVNDLGDQIVSLNRQIYALEIDGKTANDLRDQRELLVDELSEIVNVRVDEADDKYRVSVSGISFVDHDYVNKIEYKVLTKEENEEEDKEKVKGEKELIWENGNKVKLSSGELKGLYNLYVGNGKESSYRGIPFYQERLDQFARGFAKGFNKVHKKGYTHEGKENILFFTAIKDGEAIKSDKFGDDYSQITAATLTLSGDILDSLNNIATAGAEEGAAEDNRNVLELIHLRENNKFFEDLKDENGNIIQKLPQGTPDDFIKSMLSNMAVDSMQAERMNNSQNLILKNISKRRESIQGVSLEEEGVNMVNYQHAYVASAKMVNTIDTIMEVTINRLGLVGR